MNFRKFSIAAAAAWMAALPFPAVAQDTPSADTTATEEETTADSAQAAPAADLFDKDEFALAPIVCPFKGELQYDPEKVSCMLLTVPENREKARPRDIQLHVVKLAARQPDDWDAATDGEWSRRDDPIVYLTGGPGAKAFTYVKRFMDHGARDHRDLYILEQRGIGFSEDFCPLYYNFDPAASNTPDYEASQRAGNAALEACFARADAAGVDLSGYNTIENARDVKALRVALGFDEWNVWGISYGSILGQAYLKEDPDGVRAAVLDAIVPIDPAINFQGVARHFARDLDLLKKACDADEICAAAFPDFVERLKAAMVKVKDQPIEVDAIDEELFPSGKAWFFADLIGGAAFVQLYEQKNYGALPAFIDALATIVETGDTDGWSALTGNLGGGGLFPISQGMYNAIACNDGWVTQYREALETDYSAHPELALINGSIDSAAEVERICRRYDMRPRDPAEYAPLVTDIPMIVAEGEMDPITPPPFAHAIMPGLSNATYVEFPYAGHGPTRSVECAGDFLTAFYDDPEGEVDTSCADGMEAPEFIGPLYRPDGVLRLAALAGEDPKLAAPPAAWFGVSALVLLISSIILTLAPVARVVNGEAAATTGGARPFAWLAALLGAGSAAGLGYAIYESTQAADLLLFVGLVGWAKWAVVAGLGAGLLGALSLGLLVKSRARTATPIGTLIGILGTGAAAIALALFYVFNGFPPF